MTAITLLALDGLLLVSNFRIVNGTVVILVVLVVQGILVILVVLGILVILDVLGYQIVFLLTLYPTTGRCARIASCQHCIRSIVATRIWRIIENC